MTFFNLQKVTFYQTDLVNAKPGGGVLPYISDGGMFFAPFGLKTGIDFVHFGPQSSMVFEGTTGVYERICRFNSK